MTDDEYILRPAEPGDVRFVVKSWLDSYRSSKSNGFLVNTPFSLPCSCGLAHHYDYATVMKATIERLIHQPDVHIIVATDPFALPPNDLFGFIVHEKDPQIAVYPPPHYHRVLETSPLSLVHYIFVKKTFRGFGIARALFRAAGVDPLEPFLYTCSTPLSVEIEKARKIPRAKWEPSCARFEKETGQVHEASGHPPSVQRASASPAALERPRRDHEQRR